MDPSRDLVDSGKPTTQRPPDYGNDHAVWLERAERLVEGIADETRAPSGPRRQQTAPGLRRVIRKYEGRDCVYVAFHEGCSESLVYKVRASLELDGLGFSKAKPLTSRELPVAHGDDDASG